MVNHPNRSKMQDRLVVALGLALDEIHHPGAARSAGFDVIALCEGIIKEATRAGGIPQMIREETVCRASNGGMTYEQFCMHLHSYTRTNGLGYDHETLRNTPYPYAEVFGRWKGGLCTVADAENSFADAVRRHVMGGRQISEAN